MPVTASPPPPSASLLSLVAVIAALSVGCVGAVETVGGEARSADGGLMEVDDGGHLDPDEGRSAPVLGHPVADDAAAPTHADADAGEAEPPAPPSTPPACVPARELCNGADDDCDGATDEGLAGDHGPFAGCRNYRGLLDDLVPHFDRYAAGPSFYHAPGARELEGVVASVPGLIARAEFYRESHGLSLPAGTRQRILDQAIDQADAYVALEAGASSAVAAARRTAGMSRPCRGWVDSEASPVVGQYTTGQVLYGLATLSRALYEDPPSGDRSSYLAKAAAYHDVVGEVVDHWMDESEPNHFFTADESAGRVHYFCDTERRSDCVRADGQRLVKWNKQSWTWRAVAVWNDVANDHRGMATTYRRIRAMRYVRWMKQDLLDSSGAWSESRPYVWHGWADWRRTWDYVEDASHGAWDVGLLVEAWEGDFREWDVDASRAVMGPGSARRLRRTYLDNLARSDSCVWSAVDGRHVRTLATGRRSALSEWVGIADGDQAFLAELQQDITGDCEGYSLAGSSAPRIVLGLTRLFVEARAIRGE